MAGVEFKKYAMSQAGEMGVHYDNEIRRNEKVHHSNKNINPALTHLNYFIGAGNYQDIVQRMERAVERADEAHPPQRVRSDRKHWFILEAKCPPELEGTDEEDKFYQKTFDLYKRFLPLEGAAVHKDEKEEYYDPRKKKMVYSRNHIDMFGACITPDGRCNCKNLLTPEMCKKVNDEMQKMCLEEWGISYQTGEGRKGAYKSVEQLKQESQIALQAKLAKEGLEVVGELRQEKKDLQEDIEQLEEIRTANASHIGMQDKQIEQKQTALQNAQKTMNEFDAKIRKKKQEAEELEARFKEGVSAWVDAHNGLQRILRASPRLSDSNRRKIERRMEQAVQRGEQAISEATDDITSLLRAADEMEFGKQAFATMKKAAKENLDIDELLDDDFER